MATLTYNPNEQAEGELTAEEQESLEVGEKLAEQQGEMLAGKFKNAEELEQGYIELQKKLGEPKEEKAEPEKPEAKEEKSEEVDTSFFLCARLARLGREGFIAPSFLSTECLR